MQHPPRTESPKLDLPPRFVLTTQCPDTTGIVAAVAGFLAAHNCLITEAQHFDDPVANVSFMRTVFHDNGHGIPMELDGRLDRGHGMMTMKQRAKQMQGQCLVESGPGYGTVIRLTLPLDRATQLAP